jgi:hypothetical protein
MDTPGTDHPVTLITGAGVFWLFYVLNAHLDEHYGCEHGTLYK